MVRSRARYEYDQKLFRSLPSSGFVLLATMLLLSAAGARAATFVILPPVDSYEYFGLNFANNIQTSSAVGTLTYTGGPGCGGTCVATTQLGSDPGASLNVNEVAFDETGGGYAESALGYYVEYVNSPGTYTVNLNAPGSLSVPTNGVSQSSIYLGLGPAGGEPGTLGNFASYTLQEADCVNGCPYGFDGTPAAFATNNSVQMIEGTPYFVLLDLTIDPGTTNQQLMASIDPQFSTTATGGYFAYSAGVTGSSAVPEPGALVLMLSGIALLCGLPRRAATK
jgi:hypothetical protein